MKKLKKILAVLVAMAMVMAMGMTSFATDFDGVPKDTDTVDVKITGLTGNPTVTLYKIAKANYGKDGQSLVDYTWSNGIGTLTSTTKAEDITADDINTIAQGILATPQTIAPLDTIAGVQVTTGTYTQNVAAGAYIAIITGADDNSVYNPILLSATYGTSTDAAGNVTGTFEGGAIDAKSMYGTTAVAKMTQPKIDKTVAGATTDESDGDKSTASVGDVLTYTITPTMPNYPANATNKTFFVADNMTDGLTFDYTTLKIKIGEDEITMAADDNTFTYNGKVIATAHKNANGFNLLFDYDNLVSDANTGAVYVPVVTYQAVVNSNAVVGNSGNTNDADLYFSSNPNDGTTWDNPTTAPDQSATEYKSESSTVTIYTYQVAFKKIDSATKEPLSGALFGIYKDEECKELVDQVLTNEAGLAVSTSLASGTYYVKEIAAPEGYSLSTVVYPVTADWSTATTTTTGTVTDVTYTSVQSEGATQVGWLKDNVFYSMNTTTADAAETAGYVAAYIAKDASTTSANVTFSENATAGGGTAVYETEIPNTTISSLPSTGGIGTTIFTIGGCLIMIVAAFFFFRSRRKSAE